MHPGRAGRPVRTGGPVPLRDQDPRRIGDYRLIGRLGEGGMGHVYLARSDRGRTVAVKLVRAELAGQDAFRTRFRREVRAARRVGGEWTAPVLDADTEAETPWVATGYIAGPSLQQTVGGGTKLPERTVRILAAGLARALESVHAAGIIHRDLKPSNVLLTLDGPRVIDFGIARALEAVTDHGVTRTGEAVGSPGFMAPEQVRGDDLTPACDVFCLGSVLAYAATGRSPFGTPESQVHAVMYRIAEAEPDLAAVPEGLRPLVSACLAKDPAARPSPAQLVAWAERDAAALAGTTADDEPWLPGALVARLGRGAVELLEAEHPETGGDPATAPAPAPAPRRRRGATTALIIASALALAGAGAGGAYFLLRNDHATTEDNGATGGGGSGGTPAGRIPAAFLGTWEASADGSADVRRFTLAQGAAGDTVLTMTASGAAYSCTFSAALRSAGPPVRLGPSRVVSGPATSCRPGAPSTLEKTDEGLRRSFDGDGGASALTYRKVR
ncbi:serine/threonine protein kinase [Streptomyces benahoarensis]|uniref:Serine/threonine protein kinase n=1 Tax=Streptomyces benahoarensis TaxID=2595054 RepID=A0A553YZT7_9ACTN|nr:serine/threonine protein kinase [Streptomyces benahoarensis]